MLHDLLTCSLHADPERILLEFGPQAWSAEQLDEQATRLAKALTAWGLEPGDRVASLLPNWPEVVLIYLACFKAGLIAVPLDYRHHAKQVGYALRHSGAAALFVHPARLYEMGDNPDLEEIDHLVTVGPESVQGLPSLDDVLAEDHDATLPTEFAPDDLAVMIYTSGTTSRPKGVTLTRQAVAAGVQKFLAVVPLRPEDNTLIAAPISRPFALRTQLLPTLFAGGRVTLLEHFTPDSYVAALQQPPNKTFLALLPSSLEKVLQHPEIRREDFQALRLCIVGGDRVPTRLHQEFRELTGIELTEQCGMSEVGMYALNPPFGRKKPGAIGLPMYGAQVCVLDDAGNDVAAGTVGEIIVNSPLMMEGYWNDTAQTRKTLRGGWIRTGDLGRFDEDGYLWFVGRKKDVIVRDGSNVAPVEVESVLLEHPAVQEACVVGVTDAEHGQAVHAFVTLREEPSATTTEQLLAHAREHLAEYQVPDAVVVLEEMLRTGSGKMDRDRLTWQAEAGNMEL